MAKPFATPHTFERFWKNFSYFLFVYTNIITVIVVVFLFAIPYSYIIFVYRIIFNREYDKEQMNIKLVNCSIEQLADALFYEIKIF